MFCYSCIGLDIQHSHLNVTNDGNDGCQLHDLVCFGSDSELVTDWAIKHEERTAQIQDLLEPGLSSRDKEILELLVVDNLY